LLSSITPHQALEGQLPLEETNPMPRLLEERTPATPNNGIVWHGIWANACGFSPKEQGFDGVRPSSPPAKHKPMSDDT